VSFKRTLPRAALRFAVFPEELTNLSGLYLGLVEGQGYGKCGDRKRVREHVASLLPFKVFEVANLAFLGTWNSEIYTATTGRGGTVMSIFVGQRS